MSGQIENSLVPGLCCPEIVQPELRIVLHKPGDILARKQQQTTHFEQISCGILKTAPRDSTLLPNREFGKYDVQVDRGDMAVLPIKVKNKQSKQVDDSGRPFPGQNPKQSQKGTAQEIHKIGLQFVGYLTECYTFSQEKDDLPGNSGCFRVCL